MKRMISNKTYEELEFMYDTEEEADTHCTEMLEKGWRSTDGYLNHHEGFIKTFVVYQKEIV